MLRYLNYTPVGCLKSAFINTDSRNINSNSRRVKNETITKKIDSHFKSNKNYSISCT